MVEAATILARIDRAIRELEAIRAEVVASMPAPVAEGNGLDVDDFAPDSLREGVRRLGERLREVKEEEEQARRRAAYDITLVERDKLAAELAEVYPPFVEKLADLAARIRKNDAATAPRDLPLTAPCASRPSATPRSIPTLGPGPKITVPGGGTCSCAAFSREQMADTTPL